ncbi:MAG TPA: hypothetical protein VFE98_00385 [Candidatus Bathyarchaeia archaeon]|nr:hypothetical protein [Candidatus Bathyarchaeia archaeon]
MPDVTLFASFVISPIGHDIIRQQGLGDRAVKREMWNQVIMTRIRDSCGCLVVNRDESEDQNQTGRVRTARRFVDSMAGQSPVHMDARVANS